MSRRMFRSGGRGNFVDRSTMDTYQYDGWYKKKQPQGVVPEEKNYSEEKAKFFKAIGKKPKRNDEYSIIFNIGFRKGKTWWQIAQSILGRDAELEDELDDQKPTPDPNRGKGIQARLNEWYEKTTLKK